jgi:uncharacterized protein YndB with AHSA1/START domain
VTPTDDDHDQLGTLDRAVRTIRFTRSYAHPVDTVWEAVSDPDRLSAWFPQRVVGDLLTPGSALRFESTEAVVPPFDGEVFSAEAPRTLEFRWSTDVIRFELRPSDEGCVFTLSDVMDTLGKAARDGAGWHTCLDFLAGALDGSPPEFTVPDRWVQVHPRYVAAFGPEASTIGPPEGYGS